jgi:hypothetical protein
MGHLENIYFLTYLRYASLLNIFLKITVNVTMDVIREVLAFGKLSSPWWQIQVF